MRTFAAFILFSVLAGTGGTRGATRMVVESEHSRGELRPATAIYDEDAQYTYAAVVGRLGASLPLNEGSSYVLLLRISRDFPKQGGTQPDGIDGYLFKHSIVLLLSAKIDSAEVALETRRENRKVLNGTVQATSPSKDERRAPQSFRMTLNGVVLRRDPETLRRAFLEYYSPFAPGIDSWSDRDVPDAPVR